MDRIAKALRWLMRQRWWLPLMAVFTAALWVRPGPTAPVEENRRYLTATRALTAGGRVRVEDFEIARQAQAPADGVTDQQVDWLRGMIYARDLAPGEILTLSAMKGGPALSQVIPPGHRAYAIHPENPWLAKAGDHIDILVRPSDGSRPPLVLVEQVGVLQRRGEGGQGELVVALRQREVELLEKAQQQGKLSIALLGKEDSRRSRPPGPARKSSRTRRSSSVEVIIGM